MGREFMRAAYNAAWKYVKYLESNPYFTSIRAMKFEHTAASS